MISKKVIEFAKKKHTGQTRTFEKKPFIAHPLRVAQLVKKYKKSHKIDELISAAILLFYY